MTTKELIEKLQALDPEGVMHVYEESCSELRCLSGDDIDTEDYGQNIDDFLRDADSVPLRGKIVVLRSWR
jgi:hypothetical protein